MPSGFSTSAAVCDTTQLLVLQAVVAKLRLDIPQFNNETVCFVCDQPWPSVEVNENLFCTVAPMSSSFSQDHPIGAGPEGIIEIAGFMVSVFSRIETDQIERAILSFTDTDRGLLILKRLVLKSLAGQQLVDPDGANLLIEYMKPVNSMHPPSKQHDDDWSSFGIVFEGPFYWDLT